MHKGADRAVQPKAMDFEGQRLAEKLLVWIIVAVAVLSFLVGYATSDFTLMAKLNGAGLVLAALVVLPDWPWFNRKPLAWLPPLNPVSTKS